MASYLHETDSDEDWTDRGLSADSYRIAPAETEHERQISDITFTDDSEDGCSQNKIDHFRHDQSICTISTRGEIVQNRILGILLEETQEAFKLRKSKCFNLTSEIFTRQFNEIETAFHEVNYLRAELAQLCEDTSKNTLEKQYIIRYTTAMYKEVMARKHYAELVLAGARRDAELKTPNAVEDWMHRINSDVLFVSEVVAIQKNKESSNTLHKRKKNEFDVNRGKAILKADQRALRKAFPDYKNLMEEAAKDIHHSGFKLSTTSEEDQF